MAACWLACRKVIRVSGMFGLQWQVDDQRCFGSRGCWVWSGWAMVAGLRVNCFVWVWLVFFLFFLGNLFFFLFLGISPLYVVSLWFLFHDFFHLSGVGLFRGHSLFILSISSYHLCLLFLTRYLLISFFFPYHVVVEKELNFFFDFGPSFLFYLSFHSLIFSLSFFNFFKILGQVVKNRLRQVYQKLIFLALMMNNF